MQITEVLDEQFTNFASYVIINNLPSIDGLLPVQRKSIWALYINGVSSEKPFLKLHRAGAFTMVFYIMGDIPLFGAMKNMATNGLNHMYLTPKGSFGDKRKKNDNGASPRYIECKLSSFSEKGLLKGINKNSVPMKRNFDNTEDEPIVLPSVTPNILANTSQSIAVGMASKIPSHNMIDLSDSIIYYIKTKDIDEAINILRCPDFDGTKGQIIYDKDVFNKIYKTGKGSFSIIGNYTYDKENNIFSITEVPYESYIEDIEDKLEKAYEKGLFKEITYIHNASGVQGIQLDITLKKNTNIQAFEQKLRKYTPYESKFSCNFTLLDLDGKTPKLMSLADIYDKWIHHRINCLTNETKYSINQINKQLNKLYGLQIINNDLDKAIELIRSSKTEKESIERLVDYFKLNQEQVDYISDIRLPNINQEWLGKKIKNIKDLEQELKTLTNFISDESFIKDKIIEQLQDVKKEFGKERQTKIIYPEDIEEISETQLIEEYNTVCYLSKEGYFKKVPSTSLRGSTVNKLKEGDEIIYTTESSNKSTILLFSNKGICYKLYQHEIDDCKLGNLGLYLPQQLQLDKDEQIISMVSTRKYAGYLIVAFNTGKIAKIDMSSFKTKTMRSKLDNALNLESPIINMFVIEKDIDLLLKSSIDKVLVTNTSFINSKASKNTAGNQIQKQKNNSITELCVPLLQINPSFDAIYYRTDTGKGIGNYLRKTDEIELIK